MTKYHAVMLDETGCEFGVSVEADTREAAYATLADSYVESRCVQLESPSDAADREHRMYQQINREEDGYGDDDYDLEDECEDDDLEDDGQPDEMQEWADYDPNC